MKIRGQLFLLKVGDGGDPEVFSTIAGQRVTSKTIGNDQIDSTDKDHSRWRKFIEGGVRGMVIDAKGLVTDFASFQLIRELASSGEVRNFQVQFMNGYTLTGPFQIDAMGIDGEYTDSQQYNITLTGYDDIDIDLAETFALLLTETGGQPVLLVENGQIVLIVETGFPGASSTARQLVNEPAPSSDSIVFMYGPSGEPIGVELAEFTTSLDVKNRQVQLYLASTTWNKPDGARFITVECVGGGGGGCGGQRTGPGSGGGGGGGGGAYTIEVFDADEVPDTVAITVGAAGAGGAPHNSNSTAGGTTSFGTLLFAYGGGAGGPGFLTQGGSGGGGGGTRQTGGTGASSNEGVGGLYGGANGGPSSQTGSGGNPGADTLIPGGGGGGGGGNNNDGVGAGGNGGRAVRGGQGGGAGGGTSTGTGKAAANGSIWNTTAQVLGGVNEGESGATLHPVFALSLCGAGGGGGAGRVFGGPAAAGSGGAGQTPGGGGGGGGQAVTGQPINAEPGSGGSGGAGCCRVTVEF